MVESTAFKTQAEGLGGVCTRVRVCMCPLGDMGGRGGSVAFDSSMTIIFVFLYSPVVVVTWFYF